MAKIPEHEKAKDNSSEEESSSGEYETGSSSEEESEPEIQQTQVTKSESKPRPDPSTATKASKPVDAPPKLNNGAKKPVSGPTPIVTPAKRPAAEETNKTKKKKLEHEPETTPAGSQKALFQRVWCDGDEDVILKGMIDYAELKKSSPTTDMDAFHEFIKKDLQADANTGQLKAKITKLKKKYENNKKRYEENKLKNQERETFELCHKVWGNGVALAIPKVNDGEGKSAKKHKSVKNDAVENKVVAVDNGVTVAVSNRDVAERVPLGERVVVYCADKEEKISKMGADYFERGDESEGAKEWKKLLVEEMEVDLKAMDLERARLNIKQARTKLVLDRLKSGIH